MSSPMKFAGRTALVTGAGSGIGRAIAHSLAHRGCHLALADINETGLAETQRGLADAGVRVGTHRLDVADPAGVAALPAAIAEAHGGLDLLVNNAGVALGGTFEEVSEQDFDWLLSINLFGVIRMTRAFLPMLRRSDDARIVNLSSIFGMIAPPGQVAYVTSKFAVRGFSESLRQELAGSTVGVTAVHPGGVATNIAKDARPPEGAEPGETARLKAAFEKALVMPPAEAGEVIVKAVEARRARVIVGRDAQIAALAERLFPVRNWALLSRARGRR